MTGLEPARISPTASKTAAYSQFRHTPKTKSEPHYSWGLVSVSVATNNDNSTSIIMGVIISGGHDRTRTCTGFLPLRSQRKLSTNFSTRPEKFYKVCYYAKGANTVSRPNI